MKTKTTPSTVRLTPKATAALIDLEIKRPGIGRAALVEMSLLETVILANRLPITDEEFKHAAYIYRYLLEVATAHTTGPKRSEPEAGQIGLAAKTAAMILRRVFLEAKGRIGISTK